MFGGRRPGQAFVTLAGMGKLLTALTLLLLTACGDAWNTPYAPDALDANTLYAAFTDRPKHLDPAQQTT